ncbi:ABC transporter permease [Plantactinospora sp. KBS50]|uniref:ABC transporter permease n=1 Tax=Plantactinospora sp. KBS50 TaxID=2024580 RepID=UPI0018E05090|nr:ABC transporter permease [Plantactinospora sp. KBS50]
MIRRQLNLDQPLYVQYLTWLGNVLQGDLGTSLFSRQPVLEILVERLPTTLQLAFGGMFFGIAAGIPMGVLAAVRAGSIWDQVSRLLALVGVSVPVYWLGLLLIEYLALELRLFPAGGSVRDYGVTALVLPCAAIGAGFAGIVARTTRSAVIECLGESYIDTARAKGLAARRVLWTHGVRNALVPVVTVIGLQFGVLLGGAVITESIFALPGLGQLLMQSISQRDFPIMQGCVLVIAVGFVLVNFVTDLLYSLIDPRIRLG